MLPVALRGSFESFRWHPWFSKDQHSAKIYGVQNYYGVNIPQDKYQNAQRKDPIKRSQRVCKLQKGNLNQPMLISNQAVVGQVGGWD